METDKASATYDHYFRAFQFGLFFGGHEKKTFLDGRTG
jgi:hypothetical protein